MKINELILYRNFKRQDILSDFVEVLGTINVLSEVGNNQVAVEDAREIFTDVANRLIQLADDFGFEGNLWHCFLAYLLINNENPFSRACEIRGHIDGSMNAVAMHDFRIFRELFAVDIVGELEALESSIPEVLAAYTPYADCGKCFNERIRNRICEMAVKLSSAESDEEFMAIVTQFYGEFGVGKFGLNKAFRVEHKGDDVIIEPISKIAHVDLDDLVGYELAKQKLIDNTEAFVAGKPANNCLLYGDAGTGKSSSIKGIVNKYYDKGLRIIEVYKHQFKDLNDIVAQIKNRNYRFIIYMDDLSFEEFEIEYKYLKAVIEGGLEKKPDNILIYATSNRRHLVRESFRDKNDRDEDLHTNDTVQEKLSLANRFGVNIYFGRPDKKEFQTIVETLARRNGITMPQDELFLAANKWELTHGGLSGRTAQQFIDYILGSM